MLTNCHHHSQNIKAMHLTKCVEVVSHIISGLFFFSKITELRYRFSTSPVGGIRGITIIAVTPLHHLFLKTYLQSFSIIKLNILSTVQQICHNVVCVFKYHMHVRSLGTTLFVSVLSFHFKPPVLRKRWRLAKLHTHMHTR